MFGGGRNLDFAGERTETLSYNELILADLLDKLNTIILPDTQYEIDYAWAGIMAFGNDKFPLVIPHGRNIFLGARLGGMGVAMGSEVGDRLADLITAES
jgi:glycine/D-amino acid oxidase-like deaminating enzyme